MSNKKFGGANAKGYYIALALCALAIGISGYLYYANANDDQTQLSGPDASVAATNPTGQQDTPVVATQPGTQPTVPTQDTTPTTPVQKKPMAVCQPVEGQIVAVYAMDALGYNPTTRDWRVHNGIDIAAQEGAKVCAAADGEVYTVYEDDTMGMTVVIRHEGGYVTRYASLAQEVSVKAGDTVKAGQQIGTVGDSALLESAIGCHVHFSVTKNDEPMDPEQFLAQG